jgi:hypothetical protein
MLVSIVGACHAFLPVAKFSAAKNDLFDAHVSAVLAKSTDWVSYKCTMIVRSAKQCYSIL